MPPVNKIKQELDEMIETGVIKLGKPVASYTLQRFQVSNAGELTTCNIVIEGCKIPLIDIRDNMLKEQEQYMHLFTDSEITSMTEGDMQAMLKQNHINMELSNKNTCSSALQRYNATEY